MCFCCCGSRAILPIAREPKLLDTAAILYLGVTPLDPTRLNRHITTDHVQIYHVTSLANFQLALLGYEFSKIAEDGESLIERPRQFHAAIINDWPPYLKKKHIVSTVRDILKSTLITEWSPAQIWMSAPASLFIDRISAGVAYTVFKDDLHEVSAHLAGLIPAIRRAPATALPSTHHVVDSRKPIDGVARVVTSFSASTVITTITPTESRAATASSVYDKVTLPSTAFIDDDRTDLTCRPSLRDEDIARFELDKLRSIARGPAELASVEFHQNDLLLAFNSESLARRGMSPRSIINFREALVKSDMGKLSFYQQWFIAPSDHSTRLLNSLQLLGHSPLTVLLRNLGRERPFLNPTFSHRQIREIMQNCRGLITYLHEFPGMIVAEDELLSRRLTHADFEETIRGFYAHNGPGDTLFSSDASCPFWAKAPYMILSKIQQSIDDGFLTREDASIFTGTIYDQGRGVFKYPDPVSALGYEHSVYDRFDGYQDSRKIREEISYMPPLAAEVDTLLGLNWNTHTALSYDLNVLLPRLLASGVVSEGEFVRLRKVTDHFIQRLEFIHSEFQKRIINASEALAALQANPSIGPSRLEIRYIDGTLMRTQTFIKEEIGPWTSRGSAEMRRFIDTHLRLPVQALTNQRFGGIYQSFYEPLSLMQESSMALTDFSM